MLTVGLTVGHKLICCTMLHNCSLQEIHIRHSLPYFSPVEHGAVLWCQLIFLCDRKQTGNCEIITSLSLSLSVSPGQTQLLPEVALPVVVF